MAASSRSKYLQIPEECSLTNAWGNSLVFIFALLSLVCASTSVALEDDEDEAGQVDGDPMHWSADRTVWQRRKDIVELFGNAAVHKFGESLTADYIKLDLESRVIEAKGECVYVAAESVIHAEALRFNLDTSAGVITNGRVTNGGFLIVGERINRLGPTKFQTHDSEYTTCHDCPGSWSFHATDVDMELEGYAYMEDVTGKIKDAPVFWTPYMVLPIKKRRQTGFLFPKMGLSGSDGFKFVLPFFWATGRSTDMTIGLGNYSLRGNRAEWEGRYALAERSVGEAVFFYQKDESDTGQIIPRKHRWAFRLEQTHEIGFRFEEKLRIQEVSDGRYPVHFTDDIEGRSLPALTSELSFSKGTDDFNAYAQGRRFRNLLFFDNESQFDTSTVQLMPRVGLTSVDRQVFSTPFYTGLDMTVSNFVRPSGSFDKDVDAPSPDQEFQPGTDPVREALRVNATPKIYTTLRPWDVVSVVPRAEYRAYYYSFHQTLPDLERGYFLFETDITTQFEKIWDTDDKDKPRYKHLVRPKLTYSRIPFKNEPESHAFLRQITKQERTGYQFDNRDIVPVGSSRSLVNYFRPLGHSLTYGFTTQWIRRRSPLRVRYPKNERIVEFAADQTFDIRELGFSEEDRIPLSRASARLLLAFDKFSSSTQYYYYPYLSRILPGVQPSDRSPHQVSTGFAYTHEKSLHQDVLEFERSVGINYSYKKLKTKTSSLSAFTRYSISDYFLPKLTFTYDFNVRKFQSSRLDLIFTSPSRCWKVFFGIAHRADIKKAEFNFDFELNLTGDGFGGLGDASG